MSNRRESLKKSLGITEYPWSSDDEENDATSTTANASQRRANESQPGQGIVLPTNSSQVQLQMGPTTSTGRRDRDRDQARKDRDFFWSLLNKPRGSSITLPRSSARPDLPLSCLIPRSSGHGSGLSLPLSLVSRPGHTAEARAEASNPTAVVRRILAFRKFNRNLSANRPSRSTSNIYPTASGSTSRVFPTPTVAAMAADVPDLIRSRPRRTQPVNEIPESQNALHNDSSAEEITGSPSILSHSPPITSGQLNDTAPTYNVDQSEDETDELTAERPSSLAPAPRDGDFLDQDVVEAAPHNTTGLALEEEVVEIDPEPETIAVADVSADSVGEAADAVPREEKPNTSTAAGEEAEQQPHGVKRKRESEDGEPHSVKEFNQSLLRLLECPVCLEWMEPPMSQCRRGHLVCSRCRDRLASCPVCRTAFSSVRNRAMEGVAEMLRYPCRHGCGREVRLRRRTPHEASCTARRYRCPAPACVDRAPLPHHDLARHFQSKHLPLVKIGRKHKFSLKVNAEQHDNWLIMALHELFHLRIDVDIRTWGVIVYVAYIGPKCMATNYTYEVTCVGQHNSRKLVYTRATHCDLESSSLNVSRQDCFHLTLDQALNFLRVKNRYCEPDKFLHFNVDINKIELDATRDDSDS